MPFGPKCSLTATMVCAVALGSSSLVAQIESPEGRSSLRGLKQVEVSVVIFHGLVDEKTIQTLVELRLRQSGLSVRDRKNDEAVREPILYVFVTQSVTDNLLSKSPALAHPLSSVTGRTFEVEARLVQRVRLARLPDVTFNAPTWTATHPSIWTDDLVASVRQSVAEVVDSFINAYLSVNPKQQ